MSPQARIAARRGRIRRVRRRVLATAAAIFAVGWSVIFLQLVSGHDPALRASAAKPARTTPSPATQTQTQTSTVDSSTGTDGSSSSPTGSGASATDSSATDSSATGSASDPSPVTTQQS